MRKYRPEGEAKPSHEDSSSQHIKVEEDDCPMPPSTLGIFETLLQQYMQANQGHVMPSSQCLPACSSMAASDSKHSCSESMIKSVFQIVTTQSKMLQTLSKKVEEAASKNISLSQRVRELEAQVARLEATQVEKQHMQSPPEVKNELKFEGEEVGKQSLLDILFGRKKYNYHLRLIEELERPLYRQRNFNLRIELVDSEGRRVENSNKIPMSLALYTCENPPKFIEKNTTGQKMLKGYVDQSLLNGECIFEKIQIREVTSHYRNSWLFLVGIPCMTPLGANKNEKSIEFTEIRPLVIEEVVVKAKKPKKQGVKKGEEFSEEV